MVPVHRFQVWRLVSASEKSPDLHGTPQELAEHLTELSHQAKLGPIVRLGGAVLIGVLDGFIGIDIDAPQILAAVGARLPPPPQAQAAKGR